MGMLHGPPRRLLWSTGGLLEWLTASESKVTLPWEIGHYAQGPQLPYWGVQVTLPSPAKSSWNLEVDCLTLYELLDVLGYTRICAGRPHACIRVARTYYWTWVGLANPPLWPQRWNGASYISKNTSLRPGRPVRQTHLTHRTLIVNQDAPGAHLTLRTQRAHPSHSGRNQTQHLIFRTQPDTAPNPQDATRGSTYSSWNNSNKRRVPPLPVSDLGHPGHNIFYIMKRY